MISAAKHPSGRETHSQSEHWLSGEAVLRRAGKDCIGHLLSNEAAARAGEPEGIHQARVAIRRLRAILSALAPFLPHEPRIRASNELRWLADTLGEARNLDVFALQILAPAGRALQPSNGFECLVAATDRRREYAHAEAEAAINSSRYTDSVTALTDWFDRNGWSGPESVEALARPIGELAPIVLEHRYGLVKKRSRHFARQSDEERHGLRISLKKMRYTAELLGHLYDPVARKRFIQQIKRLQDDLGYRNDIRVARDMLDNLVMAEPRDPDLARAGMRIVAWHDRRIAGDEARLRRHLRRFLTTEPFWSYGRNIRLTRTVPSQRPGSPGGDRAARLTRAD